MKAGTKKNADTEVDPEVEAEAIYQDTILTGGYFDRSYERFPNANSDMDDAVDATEAMLDELEEQEGMEEKYGAQWEQLRSHLFDMIHAGLT